MSSLLLLLASASAQNTALSFDGSTNWVNTSAFVVPSSGDFTVEFWAIVPTFAAGVHEFVSQGQGTTDGFYMGYNYTAGATAELRMGDKWQATAVFITQNTWYHIALEQTGGVATLYINGMLAGTRPGTTYSITPTGTGTPFTIGQQFQLPSPFNEPINGTMDELRVWSLLRTPNQLKQGMFGTVDPTTTGLIADYNFNEGTGTTVGNTTSTPGLDGAITGTPNWVSTPVTANNNAINLVASQNDHVFAQPNTAYDVLSSPTNNGVGSVEAWINPTTLNGTNMDIVGLRTDGGSNTIASFHVSSTQIGMWNGVIPTGFVTLNYAVPTGVWTHLAFVSNGTSTEVYVGTTDIGTLPEAFGSGSNVNLTVGYSKNSSSSDNEYFDGAIDEVRVWSSQLTLTDITTNLNNTLRGNESGLIALYSFDEGLTGGTNTGLNVVVDKTATNNQAALSPSFLLTGSSSNFVTSPLIPLPVTFVSFTAVAKDGQAYLQWQTSLEENSKEFIVERSTDGTHFSEIGSVPAAGSSHTLLTYTFTDANPATGTNYYRIKEKDLDSKLTYSSIRAVSFSATGSARVAWTSAASGQAEITLLPGSNELYSVIDINGRKLQQGQLSGGKLYLSGMPGGVYIVNITTQSGSQINTRILVK